MFKTMPELQLDKEYFVRMYVPKGYYTMGKSCGSMICISFLNTFKPVNGNQYGIYSYFEVCQFAKKRTKVDVIHCLN